ncbi:MAG: PQQ-dependent sugar dehydrogenase [Verrucomicrobiales bacterium]
MRTGQRTDLPARRISKWSRLAAVAAIGLCTGANAFGQLPPGVTLEDVGLGERPYGPPETSVRLVPFAQFRGQIQQAAPWGDYLYIATNYGEIYEFDLEGNVSDTLFLNIPAVRSDFLWRPPHGGLRGLAFHPEFDTNGLLYTFHQEEVGTGGTPDYGDLEAPVVREHLIAEWDYMNKVEGNPGFREVLRIAFEFDEHNGQNIGFNPEAVPGDPDYALLFACIGDNGNAPDPQDTILHDPFNVAQDFTSIHASVIRIDPLDPSGMSDAELTSAGRKRSANGKFSIPLDNPFVGDNGALDELYAKGFRNPLTLSFSPDGKPLVADVGQHNYEEINLIESGHNYGWGLHEGIFITTYADQTTGEFLGANASQQLAPLGGPDDPARTFFLRDHDGSNPRTQTIARTGPNDDGFTYPVAHFSHIGNGRGGRSAAIIGGDSYTGWWSEELRGLYLFGNLSYYQLYFIDNSELHNDDQPGDTFQLPLVDSDGMPTSLIEILGSERSDIRFGKDTAGNLYVASKTNKMIYRFEGTPKMLTSITWSDSPGDPDPVLSLTRPGPGSSYQYVPEIGFSPDAFSPLPEEEYTILSTEANGNATETLRYQILTDLTGHPRVFFRFRATLPE